MICSCCLAPHLQMPPVKKEISIGTQHQLAQNLDNLELCPDPPPKDPEKEKKKLLKKKEKLEADLAQVNDDLAALKPGICCTA